MCQVMLESNNDDDLALLLSLVRRLNIKVVTVSPSSQAGSKSSSREDRIARMRMAASDPLFLADIEEVSVDFEQISC